MYIVGIHLTDDRLAHLTEGFVASSIFVYSIATLGFERSAFKNAIEQGGQVKSMPTTFVGKLLTPMHAVAMIVPIATYLVVVPLNSGRQPAFISRRALPDFGSSQSTVSLLRVAGCIGMIGTLRLFMHCTNTLGQSFSTIGLRERPKIVSTGLYGIVRHPIYANALVQQLVLAVALWNYVPLCSFGICAVVFALKIPIEEGLIEENPEVGTQYKEYKKKVIYRLVPWFW